MPYQGVLSHDDTEINIAAMEKAPLAKPPSVCFFTCIFMLSVGYVYHKFTFQHCLQEAYGLFFWGFFPIVPMKEQATNFQ